MDDFYQKNQARLQALMTRQDALLSELTHGRVQWTDKFLLPQEKKNELFLPSVNIEDLDFSLQSLKELPEIDMAVFAKWRTLDLPIMLASGILGGLSSAFLRDYFAGLHDQWGNLDTLAGGHSGEGIDWVPNSPNPGGFGHRFKFGHDLFNPFEVDWGEYMDKAASSGTILPHWLKGAFYWLRHLLQDTFSKEGLALPGHSLLRDYIDPVKNKDLIKYFGTIKMRDIAGSGVTNLIMGGYLWGTEKELKRVVVKANYRAFSLMLGANFTNVATGLLVPPPATSLNWSAIPIIGYYLIRLVALEFRIRKELKVRDDVLNENENTLYANLQKVAGNEAKLNSMLSELMAYDEQVQQYYKITNSYQESLKNQILGATQEK